MTVARRATLLAIVAAGIFLRVVNWRDWPPGPWLDEVWFVTAARQVAHAGSAFPFFGTVQQPPPEVGFVSNYMTIPYLHVLAIVDRVAGGGIASFRAESILPSLGLLFAALLLAHEATREHRGAFLPAAGFLSTSLPLLISGRWTIDVVGLTFLITLAAGVALVAARRHSVVLAALSGLLLGSSLYVYAASRLAFVGAALVLIAASLRRNRDVRRVAAVAVVVAALVFAPEAIHYARSPGRFNTRVGTVSILSRPPADAARALVDNLGKHVALFLVSGDRNERHGDPTRPIVPAPVAGLALVGVALGIRRGGRTAFVLLACAVLSLGGLLTTDDGSTANANRLVPAIPFLLILAALAGDALVQALPERHRRSGALVLALLVLLSAAADAFGFARWAGRPRLFGVFGGPERRLADALERHREGAQLAVNPGAACRNPYTVDALLARPDDTAPVIQLLSLTGPVTWRGLPERDVLYADEDGPTAREAAARLGARLVAHERAPLPALPSWAVYRIPRERAAADAAASLARFPLEPARAGGRFVAPEGGIYSFRSVGALELELDGRRWSSTGSTLFARLAKGPHELRVLARGPGARLLVAGPDGWDRLFDGSSRRADRSASSKAFGVSMGPS